MPIFKNYVTISRYEYAIKKSKTDRLVIRQAIMNRRSLQKIAILGLAALTFLAGPSLAIAKIWLVGPNFQMTTPSAAIKRAKDGDIIKITAGLYENDYAIITQNNLTLMGVNGFAHLKSSGPVPGGKAIWTIRGGNITLQNIEFSGARVADKNGAGIRLEGGSLTLENCYFHDNEMGLMTSNNPNIRLRIINSEFNRNRQNYLMTKKLSHNIYVGAIAEFTLDNSISRGAQYGHAVKGRARKTHIKNSRILDEGAISASYLIDLPNGGEALIENNYLYKNKGAQNKALISYGGEGMKYDKNALTIQYNTAINEDGLAFLLKNHSSVAGRITGNRTTNIAIDEVSAIERDGFWDRIKNKIQDFYRD